MRRGAEGVAEVDCRRLDLGRDRRRCFFKLNEPDALLFDARMSSSAELAAYFRQDELLDAGSSSHPQPDRAVTGFRLNLEIEEWTASPLEGDPFGDFQQRDLLRCQPEGVTVVELAPLLARAHQLARQCHIASALLLVHHAEVAHERTARRIGFPISCYVLQFTT